MMFDKKSKTALITIIVSLLILGLLWFASEQGYKEGFADGSSRYEVENDD